MLVMDTAVGYACALHKAPALHVPAWQGARCAFWYAFLGPVPSLDYAWIWPEA